MERLQGGRCRSGAFVLITCILASCDGPTAPPASGIHAGIIEFAGETRITVPDTAKVGAPVSIGIQTWGGPGLAYARADTHVSISRGTVVVCPYDDFTGPNGAMPSINFPISHDRTLVFSDPGRVKIVVVGMSGPRPYEEVTRTFWLEVVE